MSVVGEKGIENEGTAPPAAVGGAVKGAPAVEDIETKKHLFAEARFKFWAALLTLIGVIAGFAYNGIQLFNQSRDLERIERSLRNLDELRAALTRPLEGEWKYRVTYKSYFGEKSPPRHMDGVAVFVWHDDGTSTGYAVIIGAGIHVGSETDSFVTGVSRLFLNTEKSGNIPQDFSMSGEYVSRTSSAQKYENPKDDRIDYTNGRYKESAAHKITELIFEFKTIDGTEGRISFTRN